MHHDSNMTLAEVFEWLKNGTLCEVLTDDGWHMTRVISIQPNGEKFKIGVLDPKKMPWNGKEFEYANIMERNRSAVYGYPELYLSSGALALRLRKAPLQGEGD